MPKMYLWTGGTVEVPDNHPMLRPIDEIKALIHQPKTAWAYYESDISKVISGALKSAADAHPEIQFPGSTRSSATKRVVGAVIAYLKELSYE